MARILVTGATDGLGRHAAELMVQQGHQVIVHGRHEAKVAATVDALRKYEAAAVEGVVADLSDLPAVAGLAATAAQYGPIDVLVNNAGVFTLPRPQAIGGVDLRFIVNTFAPIVLTRALLALQPSLQRVVTLSSAAQAPVSLAALQGQQQGLEDFDAYAQSKLAVTMWSHQQSLQTESPVFIALNPASMLGTKMVKNGFGVAGKDISIGSSIIVEAALSDEFAAHSGEYYDNDMGYFAPAHSDVYDHHTRRAVLAAVDAQLAAFELC